MIKSSADGILINTLSSGNRNATLIAEVSL